MMTNCDPQLSACESVTNARCEYLWISPLPMRMLIRCAPAFAAITYAVRVFRTPAPRTRRIQNVSESKEASPGISMLHELWPSVKSGQNGFTADPALRSMTRNLYVDPACWIFGGGITDAR